MSIRKQRLAALSVLVLPAVATWPQVARSQELSVNEANATHLSRKWRGSTGVVTHGADGKVVFLFGQVQPSVVCSPLQVCDIELQAGEVVRDVLVGDTVRWKVEPATSGAAGSQSVHLVVKPAEPGLVTSMVVTTSRRTYHVQLKSAERDYMARIGFDYPDDTSQKFRDISARLETGSVASVPAENLDFSYRMSGHARWKPQRVYSDGEKTYIQFPPTLRSQDAPVLFVVSGGENRIVNYRVKGTLMIVDYAVDKAVLVSGVGWKRDKVTITRGGS